MTDKDVNREWVRKYCMSLPHVTEQVQWQIDLVFKIGGKMFAIVVLEPHTYLSGIQMLAGRF